jgi:hypothetical protein
MRADARFVLEGEEVVVVHLGALASDVELGIDLPHRPEELQRLVDKVAAEVEQQAAALLGARALAPAVPGLRPPALEARLEAMHPSQSPLLDQPSQREEVPVPAAVLEHRHH